VKEEESKELIEDNDKSSEEEREFTIQKGYYSPEDEENGSIVANSNLI